MIIINEDDKVNREGWLWLAPEYFNQWRVFPRAFIIFYFWLCMETAMWFMGLPNPGAAQAAFASAIISAGAAWFGLYVNSGPSTRFNQVVMTPETQVNPPAPVYQEPRSRRRPDYYTDAPGDVDPEAKG